jgi:hypothetical protein
MVNRPSQPEIITVNSEALQTQIRDLLPSQNGFGSELQASNVITPIIDLTATAEGSGLSTNLQTALAFGSNTEFDVSNTTTQILNSPGFYRIVAVSTIEQQGGNREIRIKISDGLSTKDVWQHLVQASGSAGGTTVSINVDVVVWLRAGDTCIISSNAPAARIAGSHRQIATGDGTLVQPVGFPL